MATRLLFDEIPGLLAAWNAGDPGTVTAPGGIVTSIAAQEGAGTLTKPASANDLIYTGTAMIGSLAAIDTTDASNIQACLEYDAGADGIGATDPYTVFVAEQRYDTSGAASYVCRRTADAANETRVRRASLNYELLCNTDIVKASEITANIPIVMCVQTDQQSAGLLRVNGDQTSIIIDPGNTNDCQYHRFMSESPTAAGMRGRMALMVIYNRILTAEEIVEAEDLCWSWVNTGGPPSVNKPTITTPDDLSIREPHGGSYTVATTGAVDQIQWEWDQGGTGSFVDAIALSGVAVSAGPTLTTLTLDSSLESETGVIKAIAQNAVDGDAESTALLTVAAQITDTSAVFGPAIINDQSATLTWQCKRDGIGIPADDDWVPAVGNIAGAREETTAVTTFLHIDQGIVADTGQIRCLATTPYDPAGKPTAVQRLEVVAS